MNSDTKTIRYFDYNATVRRASLRDGVIRDVLITRAISGAISPEDAAYTVALVHYPAAVACTTLEVPDGLPRETVQVGGRDVPSLEEFLNFPDDFVRKWLEVVFEMNAHWSVDGGSHAEIVEKKISEIESAAG